MARSVLGLGVGVVEEVGKEMCTVTHAEAEDM